MNDKGQIIQVSYDRNMDGITDIIDVRTLDSYGRRIKTESYNGDSVTGKPAQVRTYEFDEATGFSTKAFTDIDGNGVIDAVNTYKHNIYGALTSSKEDNLLTGKSITHLYTYNERGLVATYARDDNSDGINGTDTSYVYEYNSQGLRSVGYVTRNSKLVETIYYEYNDQNRIIAMKADVNNNGYGDAGDYVVKQEWDSNGTLSKYYSLYPDGTPRNILDEYINSNIGTRLVTLWDIKHDGVIDKIVFSQLNQSFDFTGNAYQSYVARSALTEITLSNTAYATEITLDKATIRGITNTQNNVLRINGDALDTVNLKDIVTSEKLDTTTKVGANDYNQYQFADNGTTYTVLVDTDIHVTLG